MEERSFCNWTLTAGEEELCLVREYNHVFSLPVLFFSAIISKIVMCLFVLAEEYKHKQSRHNNSNRQLLKNCFQVFLTMNFLVGFCILLVSLYWIRSKDIYLFTNHWSLNWPNIITSVGVTVITNYAFGFKSLSVVENSEIHESSNINVAQGLAWSYFTGYLKIILKDLKGTIEKDEIWKRELNQGNLQCKFYAIIPRNCSIPSKLGDSDKHRGITIVSDLPVVEEPRAGVTRRYINLVYKIENEEGVSHYAICEYVTIIDTLFQMSLYTEFNAQKRDDQCRLLVRKLTELIDSNEDCRNKCVIVPFSGADDGPLLRDVLLDKIKENRVQIN